MMSWTFSKRDSCLLLRHVKQAAPILLLLGIVFLLVGVWWLGPQWEWHHQKPLSGLSMRVLLTVLLLLVPTLAWAFALRKRNRELQASQDHTVALTSDEGLRHVEAQERWLNQSLSVLRANLSGRRSLYKLPWYLVVGTEDAGKTSFINRSNQNFHLTGTTKAASQRTSDPDLAYTIDWWMGNQVVLIDMPGELISQSDTLATSALTHGESEETPTYGPEDVPPGDDAWLPGLHARLWNHLIEWLGRNRSRRPLNGIVLVVDLIALLHQRPSDRKAQAILLRSRLTELGRHLGTRPPVYVVLTKCDQLDGFAAFFAGLPRAVREDILGFTFTLDSVKHFDAWQEK